MILTCAKEIKFEDGDPVGMLRIHFKGGPNNFSNSCRRLAVVKI